MSVSIGIIGTGWVGSSVAISTLHSGVCTELLLYDLREEVAAGDAMDLSHGASFYPPASVRTASIKEMRRCNAVVVTAGRGGRPNESRLDLLKDNAATVRSIGQTFAGYEGLLVVVTNPVDVLTHVIREASGLPAARVIGTGTMLDTARLRQRLGEELRIDPRSVHAQVVGEHGDSEVVLWSGARAGGTPLRQWPGWSAEREAAIATEVRTAAYEIIRRKGATNHAIGLVTAALLKWALRGDRRVITVSRVHEDIEGVRDVALSLPVVVTPRGAEQVIVPEMTKEERAALQRSAAVLRRAIESVNG
ncbi:MAG TPA: L-lactate dehydrogenase [Thermoanaerobaculia bacterium]|nr:L-lactate dehydrogenase [Thermoanaerobaculia bacterium]